MEIEIIAIGNEVLAGFTVNTNAAYISQGLLSICLPVARHSVLPDDPVMLKQGLREALNRSQLVITTGGLGPTCDDITRQIAAELFNSDFRYDNDLADDLKQRYGELSTIRDQATVPDKANLLKNNSGTAPGIIFQDSNNTLILLPGVPSEMKQMFTEQVLPYLQKTFNNKVKCYSKQIHLFNTAEASVDPLLRQLKNSYPMIEFGIYPGQCLLSIYLIVYANSEVEANKLLEPSFQTIAGKFAAFRFEAPLGKIEYAVHETFIQRKLTLSAAESCTGGFFSSRLTALPGCSEYFLGSVIAYSDFLKMTLLDVPEDLLIEKGAVSSEVAAQMLEGLFSKVGSDFGVAVTGIAGPSGGTQEKPVGTVWCAVGQRKSTPFIWKLQCHGNREMIINQSTNALFAKLLTLVR